MSMHDLKEQYGSITQGVHSEWDSPFLLATLLLS
jgi:hypothetical protein